MSVTIIIDATTDKRELAAIACLIAVLRSNETAIPAPPRVSFDFSDERPAERPAPVAPPMTPVTVTATSNFSPPAETPAPPAPASDALIQQEAARATITGELDANDVPWDERIHAGTKVKNADNTWRTKRGADPALVTSVTAELKAQAAAASPAQPPAADVPPPPTEPAPATVADAATAFGAGGAGGASDVPPPPAPDGQSLQEKMAGVAADAAGAPAPPAAPAAGELTYPAVLSRANEAGLDYDTLNAMAVDMGLEKFASLAKAPATTLRLFADTMEAKIAEGPATPAA